MFRLVLFSAVCLSSVTVFGQHFRNGCFIKQPVYGVQKQVVNDYVQEKVIVEEVAVDQPDVYVIQNNIPQPLVGQGATQYVSVPTGYGYQQQAMPFLDPNRYFDRELQLLEATQKSTEKRSILAAELFRKTLELQAPAAQRLAEGQAAAMVLQAAGLGSEHSNDTLSQGVIINRDQYGRVQVQQLTAMQMQQLGQCADGTCPPTPPAPPQRTGSLINQYCGKCHGTDLQQPKGGFYLGSDPNVAEAMKASFFEIVEQLTSGEMPPADAAQPTDEERQALLDEIRTIVRGN